VTCYINHQAEDFFAGVEGSDRSPKLPDETLPPFPCQEFVACLSALNLLKLAREAGRKMTFPKIYLESTTPLPVLN